MISKFRYIAIFLVSLIGITSLRAQEINCTVTINSDQIEGSNKQVYETLKSAIEEYMNPAPQFRGPQFQLHIPGVRPHRVPAEPVHDKPDGDVGVLLLSDYRA